MGIKKNASDAAQAAEAQQNRSRPSQLIHHHTIVKLLAVRIIKVLTKFLERRLTHTNVIKITIPKNGGHFERRAAIGRRNTPHQSYVAVSGAQ